MARPHPALLSLARGEGITGPFEEERLLASAVDHRMEGLLWSFLAAETSHGSEEWRRLVVAQDLVNRRRSAKLESSLRRIVHTASELGVTVATVKGVVAERRWYRRPGERPFGDIDLVLAPGDLHRARDVVSTLQPDHPLLDGIAELVGGGLLQSVEIRLGDGTAVDLHFDTLKLGVPVRDPAAIWEAMEPFPLGDVAVLAPGPALALVLFLTHLTKDRFRRLLGYVDCARVAGSDDTDIEEALRLASEQGLAGHVTLAYRAAAEVVPMPPLPVSAVEPGWSTRALWSLLWRPSTRLLGTEGIARFRRRQDWLGITALGRRRAALWWWVRRRVFPPRSLLVYRQQGRGPYLWRITLGRLAAALRRRRDTRRRRHVS